MVQAAFLPSAAGVNGAARIEMAAADGTMRRGGFIAKPAAVMRALQRRIG
jgi:hypothetical protein